MRNGPQYTLNLDLTPRETEVLRGIAEGLKDFELARCLYVERQTIRTHVKNLRWKLEARDRAHAVALGFRKGLLR